MTSSDPAPPGPASMKRIFIALAFLVAVGALAYIGAVNLIDATLRAELDVRDSLRKPVQEARITLTRPGRNVKGGCTATGECRIRATVSIVASKWQLEVSAPGYKPLRQEVASPARYIGTVTLAKETEAEASTANLRTE
jgi:hypothetical protein